MLILVSVLSPIFLSSLYLSFLIPLFPPFLSLPSPSFPLFLFLTPSIPLSPHCASLSPSLRFPPLPHPHHYVHLPALSFSFSLLLPLPLRCPALQSSMAPHRSWSEMCRTQWRSWSGQHRVHEWTSCCCSMACWTGQAAAHPFGCSQRSVSTQCRPCGLVPATRWASVPSGVPTRARPASPSSPLVRPKVGEWDGEVGLEQGEWGPALG